MLSAKVVRDHAGRRRAQRHPGAPFEGLSDLLVEDRAGSAGRLGKVSH